MIKIQGTPFLSKIRKEQPLLFPFFFYFIRRTSILGKYNFSAFIGEQGSGKSYIGIITAMVCDPYFDNSDIVFNAKEFLDSLDELEARYYKGRFKIWDDAGVGLPAKEWLSISNRIIGLIMQTVRTLNPSIVFTMPDLSLIDATQRRSLSSVFVVEKKAINKSTVKPYTKKRIYIKGEEITKKMTFGTGLSFFKYGTITFLHFTQDNMPEVLKIYEKQQQKFKYETREKLKGLLSVGKEISPTDALIHTKDLKDLENKLLFECYKEILEKPYKFMTHEGELSPESIKRYFKISIELARKLVKFFEKGITLEQLKDALNIDEEML